MKKFIVNPAKKLNGEITVPGDKSISHRAVMLGSIAKGDTTVENFLNSDDCLRTVECFRKMGIEISVDKGSVVIKGKGLRGLKEPSNVFDVGNSGTTIRAHARWLSLPARNSTRPSQGMNRSGDGPWGALSNLSSRATALLPP